MDNTYQQKLKERAEMLKNKWLECDDSEYTFQELASLPLKWSAIDIRQALYSHSIFPRTDYIRSKGFIPPKTDNNEG